MKSSSSKTSSECSTTEVSKSDNIREPGSSKTDDMPSVHKEGSILRRSKRLAASQSQDDVCQDIQVSQTATIKLESVQNSEETSSASKSVNIRRKRKSELDLLYEDLRETNVKNVGHSMDSPAFRTRSHSSCSSIQESITKTSEVAKKKKGDKTGVTSKKSKPKKAKYARSSPIRRVSHLTDCVQPSLEPLEEVEEIENELNSSKMLQEKIKAPEEISKSEIIADERPTRSKKKSSSFEKNIQKFETECGSNTEDVTLIRQPKAQNCDEGSSDTDELLSESTLKTASQTNLPRKSSTPKAKQKDSIDASAAKNEYNLSDSNNENFLPIIDGGESLWKNRSDDTLLDGITKGYHYIGAVDKSVKNLTQYLLKMNEEGIWQQISFGNKNFLKHAKKQENLLEIALSIRHEKEIPKIKSVEVREEIEGESDQEFLEDAIFDHPVSCLKNVNETSHEVGQDLMTADGRKRKYPKSEVDDQFFSLAEMDEILDKQEANEFEEGFFDDVEIDDKPVNYRYSDFYDATDEPSSSGKNKKKAKKVTFAGLPSEEEDEEDDDENYAGWDNPEEHDSAEDNDDLSDQRILLGKIDELPEESEFSKLQAKLREKISRLEESNLAPRKWDLSGEVTAVDRPENAMLEQYVDFEHAAKLPPVVTVDTTAKLESIIIQRIKDKAFDDVVRVVRDPVSEKKYKAEVDEKIVKKSLTEVYEERYQKDVGKISSETVENEKHKSIEKLMSELFKKLDALSHYKFVPPQAQPEIKIINNMASLQKEEVGPLASTNEYLLAPEEVKPNLKGELKGKDERDKSDRARERRKKKKLQRKKKFISDLRKERDGAKTDGVRKSGSKLKKSSSKKKDMKSSAFFTQLQQSVTDEVKRKFSKRKTNVKENKSTKFML